MVLLVEEHDVVFLVTFGSGDSRLFVQYDFGRARFHMLETQFSLDQSIVAAAPPHGYLTTNKPWCPGKEGFKTGTKTNYEPRAREVCARV